jgi:methylase of polypeptide subunit release factors
MHKNVLDFEPHLALFVLDEDALIFYRKIGELGIKSIEYKGQIFFEINEQKAAELVHIFNSMGYNNAKTIKDNVFQMLLNSEFDNGNELYEYVKNNNENHQFILYLNDDRPVSDSIAIIKAKEVKFKFEYHSSKKSK